MKFTKRFAMDDQHHSFTLTADGCMDRNNPALEVENPRSLTVAPRRDHIRDLELNSQIELFGRGAEADERLIQNYVFTLAKHGLQPSKTDTIESFIIKHLHILQQYQ